MGDSWFAGVVNAPWAPVAAAYIFGLVTGWLIWSGSRASAGPIADEHDSAPAAPLPLDKSLEAADAVGAAESAAPEGKSDGREESDPCPATMKLGAIESELRRARELLAAEDGDGDLAGEISMLDTALKRANGRLKLLLKSVKRAKPGK